MYAEVISLRREVNELKEEREVERVNLLVGAEAEVGDAQASLLELVERVSKLENQLASQAAAGGVLSDRITAVEDDIERWEDEGGPPAPEPEREPQVPDFFPDFASDAARKRADELGMIPAHFSGHQPSGHSGFTVADVNAVATSISDPNPENQG